MSLPLNDWQFWAVSITVLVVVLLAVRPFLPGLRRKRSTRVSLTVERRKPDE